MLQQVVVNLEIYLVLRYELTGNEEDLEEGISATKEAVKLTLEILPQRQEY
jgi:hypothetical protein